MFFPFGAPTPPHLPSPTLPRVSITVSLHLSLARTGRSFLMLAHTHAQTHTHAHKYGVEHTFEHKWSIVECAAHTLLILICSMLSFVNTAVSHVSVTCVKGATGKHQLPHIILIHHFLSNSGHNTWNHRALCMIDGVNYRRLMFRFLSQGRKSSCRRVKDRQ